MLIMVVTMIRADGSSLGNVGRATEWLLYSFSDFSEETMKPSIADMWMMIKLTSNREPKSGERKRVKDDLVVDTMMLGESVQRMSER